MYFCLFLIKYFSIALYPCYLHPFEVVPEHEREIKALSPLLFLPTHVSPPHEKNHLFSCCVGGGGRARKEILTKLESTKKG